MADFSRTEALLGSAGVARLAEARVVVIGVGGVGGWCAEALVRSGVGHLTLVDDDVVAPSNVNRQSPATAKTIGSPKVEAMRGRLLEINPACEVVAVRERYPSAARLRAFSSPDLLVDAIDSVDCKAELILDATEAGVPIVSSMGAARRFDPTRVAVKRFDRVEGDGLARALRRQFRKLGRFPGVKFKCVCSEETPQAADGGRMKGSLMPVTCAFGMVLAAEAIQFLSQER